MTKETEPSLDLPGLVCNLVLNFGMDGGIFSVNFLIQEHGLDKFQASYVVGALTQAKCLEKQKKRGNYRLTPRAWEVAYKVCEAEGEQSKLRGTIFNLKQLYETTKGSK